MWKSISITDCIDHQFVCIYISQHTWLHQKGRRVRKLFHASIYHIFHVLQGDQNFWAKWDTSFLQRILGVSRASYQLKGLQKTSEGDSKCIGMVLFLGLSSLLPDMIILLLPRAFNQLSIINLLLLLFLWFSMECGKKNKILELKTSIIKLKCFHFLWMLRLPFGFASVNHSKKNS